MKADVRDTILDQVEKDLQFLLPVPNENVYGFGKQVARLANLAKIVYEFQRHAPTNSQNDKEVHAKSKAATGATNQQQKEKLDSLVMESSNLLYSYLSKFFHLIDSDNLVYDTNFGGIITWNGLLNMQEDFGNGWYNDHHFHYGYILYASAIMAKLNSTFVDEFGIHVDSLLNDVAHDSNQDSNLVEGSFFPFTRHKSWFDGHSYASGLFPFADGKSQESSSEAVNCYYGAYLWTLISTKRRVEKERKNSVKARSMYKESMGRINFMKLLLAMEIRSTKTYWHMIPPSEAKVMNAVHSVQIYNPFFEKSLMIGNLGMMDVTVSTWFGKEELYVHMINFLPVTAITKELFDPDYVKLEFKDVLDPIYDNVEMAWRGYVISDKAIIDPSSAWNDAKKLRSFELDSAISQSQVYFWISTMDGFIAPSSSSNEINSAESDVEKDGDSWCVNNPVCLKEGLTGECCPTNKGILLGCCSAHSHLTNPQSSCEKHEKCQSSGLTGECCPTEDGGMLDCCGN